jgi:hypothetical protein
MGMGGGAKVRELDSGQLQEISIDPLEALNWS